MNINDQMLNAVEGVATKMESMKTEQAILADRLLQIEQRGGMMHHEGNTGTGTTAGDLFIKQFEASKDLFGKTGSLRLEIKAATDLIGTSSGRTIISAGVGAPNGKFIGLQNALPTRPTAGTTVAEYSRFTGTQGLAAQQTTEGSAKAAVRPDHTLIQQSALQVAGYAKLSRQALNDSSELKSAIDLTLARSVSGSLNDVLTNGGTNFTGGFLALATASTSLVYTRLADAVSEAVADMQTAGFNPNCVAMSPGTWVLLMTAQDTMGGYLSGNYMAPLPTELRGLRVELSPGITAGSALVMDTTHSELLIVNDFSVEVGYVNDDMIKNQVTILGEARVIPVFRTAGSAKLVTPKP